MLRRLHHDQPESFAFTPANQAWAEAEMAKFPEGRQASAIIPLLWRAQEQEGWLSRPAIEHVADMLGMARIRALEVATFYFMFHLAPVGRVAHVQLCGTTPCMLCGSEALIELCERKIASRPHQMSADGSFSWEEVECLGACANAPMVQIGKDYYEDLTPERLEWILDEFAAGRVPQPGPRQGRYASEPEGGLTSLTAHEAERAPHNASVERALTLGDTVARITGEDGHAAVAAVAPREARAGSGTRPALMDAPPEGGGDDLKKIKGIGPKLEAILNEMGIHTLSQIAAWSAEEVAWMDDNMPNFPGRASRDDWVGQAKALSVGEAPE